jgi:hypothetical protein
MATLLKGFENGFAASIKSGGDLMPSGNGPACLVQRFTQLQYSRSRGGLIPMEKNHRIAKIALVQGA